MNTEPPARPSRLEHFPISWFATVMGLAGGAIAWHKAAAVFGVPDAVGTGFAIAAAVAFALAALIYAAKAARHPARVAEEFHHPVRLSFFPTISIGLVLLAIVTLEPLPLASKALWWSGTALHLAFTLYVISAWMHHETFQIQHASPAWFIPVVGNVLVPIAGVHHAPAEVSWFFFALGVFFWPALFAIILNRMLFHAMLPARMVPTLFILIAPPSVAFLAYLQLNGGTLDAFARILYHVGLFTLLLLVVQARIFLRLHFFLSWWAFSFPVAAFTVATLVMYQKTGTAFFGGFAAVLLGVLSLLLVGLVALTARGVARRAICVPEG